MSELLDYHDIHGHCNVPQRYSENTKLAKWVMNQRSQYRLHLDGQASSMTPSRIQELESSGFEWDIREALWKERLNELSDYNYIHGDCDVPRIYREKRTAW
jgi:hypothetical protein